MNTLSLFSYLAVEGNVTEFETRSSYNFTEIYDN